MPYIYSPYLYREPSQPKRMPITAFITLSAAMVAGTGGMLAANNVPSQSSFGAKPFIQILDWERRRLEEEKATHIDLITRVRAAFGMNYTQLAYSLNVSRQAVYDWVNGSQPRADVLTRLWHLESLGRNLHGISAPRKRSLLLRPAIENKNLLTLIREDGNVTQGIHNLLGTARTTDTIDIQASSAPTRRKKVRRISIEDISRVLS
jgi:DNA-binding transcriptional regulator YiaG